MLRPYHQLSLLINTRPQQLPALPVQLPRRSQVIQVPREVADQQSTVRQGARPIIEPRLECARTLLRFDPPMADLDFLVDLEHPRDLEDEPGDRERPLQRRTRACIELGGILHEG